LVNPPGKSGATEVQFFAGNAQQVIFTGYHPALGHWLIGGGLKNGEAEEDDPCCPFFAVTAASLAGAGRFLVLPHPRFYFVEAADTIVLIGSQSPIVPDAVAIVVKGAHKRDGETQGGVHEAGCDRTDRPPVYVSAVDLFHFCP
jgi:hypothetical protein